MVMKSVNTFVAALLSAAVCLAAKAAPADERDLFADIVRQNSRISSIDSEITQHIRTGNASAEVYAGRYRADAAGRFRIDYRLPSKQVVLNDGASLYWYYPNDRLLYKIGRRAGVAPAGGVNPLGEYADRLSSRFRVRYEGRRLYGFFTPAYSFTLEDRESNVTLSIVIEVRRRVLLSRCVTDRDGVEIMKETYEGYEMHGGIPFPSRVSVTARSPRGIVSNVTNYSRVSLNTPFPPSLFKLELPPNVISKQMYE
jgi:outer membrane lipoprotein-sorting protein